MAELLRPVGERLDGLALEPHLPAGVDGLEPAFGDQLVDALEVGVEKLGRVGNRDQAGQQLDALDAIGVHDGKSPVVVLLFARLISPQTEITKANEANLRQRKAPDGPGEVAVVVVDTSDWSCRLPPNCSAAVLKLTDQICT